MNDINHPTEKRKKQRNLLDKIIDKPAEILIQLNISPNILSLLGILSILAGSILIVLNFIHSSIYIAWIPPFLIFIAGAFDIFDGEVARRTNLESMAGAFLDSNLDRISDTIILMGLIFGGLLDYVFGFLILFLSLMISYTRSRAESLEVNMKGVGLMERAERLIFMIIGLSLEVWVYKITYWITGTPITIFKFYFIPIFTFSLAFTVGQRFYHIYKALNDRNE